MAMKKPRRQSGCRGIFHPVSLALYEGVFLANPAFVPVDQVWHIALAKNEVAEEYLKVRDDAKINKYKSFMGHSW